MPHHEKLAILVAGGPAPGINSVISAATIRSRLEDVDVVGIRDGFQWIMRGDVDHVTPLDIEGVSRIHFRGGSHIGISRANPTLKPEHLENTIVSLLRLGVTQLITIGGDDTAFTAMKLVDKAEGRLRLVHVPKTIDNDLDLPPYVDTFGFATARHYMLILRRDDFEDPHELAKFAATVGLSLDEFRREFEYLVAHEPPPLHLAARGENALS